MDNPLAEVFIQEADDNILFLESAILKIENEADDSENINSAFRAIHSIKGGAGLAGFKDLKEFTHVVEDLFESVRSESLKIDQEVISLMLSALDVIKEMVNNVRTERNNEVPTTEVLDEIKKKLNEEPVNPIQEKDKEERKYFLSITFAQDIMGSGIDPSMFIADLKRDGKILDIEADLSTFPDKDSFNPELFYIQWNLFYQSSKATEAIVDIFCFVIDESKIDVIDLKKAVDEGQDIKKYSVNGKSLFIQSSKDKSKSLPEKRSQSDRRKHFRRTADSNDSASASFIRVETNKLENIFNSVSELIINQASLSMYTEKKDDELDDELLSISDTLKSITGVLQEQITALRMMSLSGTFDRFRRVVRDIAGELDKKVKLEIAGQDTELDKNMIEKLTDPLKHLVRNCIDHGIETEQERIEQGKDPEGRMNLSAHIENGKVVLIINDDGKGIDSEKLIEKAIERGIVKDDHTLSEDEAVNLIFHPGLSTAKSVTDLSGRGVGMDVVKNSISSLQGNVEVHSERGKGTEFIIHLPLTLAILDGMLVRVGDEKFVIPTLSILEIFRPQVENLKTMSGKGEVVFFREDYIPVIRISEVFEIKDALKDPVKGELVVVSSGGVKAALLVDAVIEQFQIVLKSLQKNFKEVDMISSATILGDGEVALVLDLQKIVRVERKKEG